MTRPSAPLAALAFSVLTAATSLTSAGCSKTFIPNTDVEDNSENRKVIVFCEKYRHAVEDKDIHVLLKLASPGYYEDNGNVRAEDDYDFAGLKDNLTTTLGKTTSIRYEIRYRRVTFTETNHVYVDYTYSAAYRIPGVKNDEWHHKVADNRLELVRDGEEFKIASGM